MFINYKSYIYCRKYIIVSIEAVTNDLSLNYSEINDASNFNITRLFTTFKNYIFYNKL